MPIHRIREPQTHAALDAAGSLAGGRSEFGAADVQEVARAAQGSAEALREALRVAESRPLNYRTDGVRRLLRASLSGGEVEPPDPTLAAIFEQERQLRSLPRAAAYELLAGQEPRLLTLRDSMGSPPRSTLGRLTRYRALRRGVARLLGPTSDAITPLCRSDVALTVAFVHLSEVSGLLPR